MASFCPGATPHTIYADDVRGRLSLEQVSVTIDTFGFFLTEEIGDVGPTAHVQLGGHPFQGHGGFRAQTPGREDLFGVALRRFASLAAAIFKNVISQC